MTQVLFCNGLQELMDLSDWEFFAIQIVMILICMGVNIIGMQSFPFHSLYLNSFYFLTLALKKIWYNPLYPSSPSPRTPLVQLLVPR